QPPVSVVTLPTALPNSRPPLRHLYPFSQRPAPRNLPPFPTRRSSDLATEGAACCRRRDAPPPFQARRLAPFCRRFRSSLCSLGSDRKSTRLNSSHQIISYPVFCFKKKTTVQHQHRRRLKHHRLLPTQP